MNVSIRLTVGCNFILQFFSEKKNHFTGVLSRIYKTRSTKITLQTCFVYIRPCSGCSDVSACRIVLITSGIRCECVCKGDWSQFVLVTRLTRLIGYITCVKRRHLSLSQLVLTHTSVLVLNGTLQVVPFYTIAFKCCTHEAPSWSQTNTPHLAHVVYLFVLV